MLRESFSYSIRSIALAAGLFIGNPVLIAQNIYRCEIGGKTTYTDYPCDQPMIREVGPGATSIPATPATQTVIGGGYVNPYGRWSGEVRYYATQPGTGKLPFNAAVHLVIEVAESGEVTGHSAENSCRMRGSAIPSFGPDYLSLNVMLSDCTPGILNQRFNGHLTLNKKGRYSLLVLNATSLNPLGPVVASVRGEVRR